MKLPKFMQIIPVLDLKDGQAVHAVRGERERYAPVQGVLGSGDDPLTLALAYRDRLGCHTCYVADLDAIAGRPAHTGLLRDLAGLGLTLWVDAGVASVEQAQVLAGIGAARIIVGSETLPSLDQLAALAQAFPPERLVLSVDLQNGVLRAPTSIDTPQQLVALAVQSGLSQVILLDLIRVGSNAGPPLELLTSLRPHFPGLAFYAGGGVRHRADLDALAQAGAAGALVATAFHRGVLTAADAQA
ncbi:MAG: HisA/HisF-related TIM barrel protein [Anaerolineae bacterium]|nr:HisA/HisF-related TIM barrel protein [Anaerolineae bacterium]